MLDFTIQFMKEKIEDVSAKAYEINALPLSI